MKIISLTITSKLPKEFKELYSGGCLTPENKLYFGWRGKPHSNMCFAVGNAMQKGLLLLNNAEYDEIVLHIDADYTETGNPEKISIKKS